MNYSTYSSGHAGLSSPISHAALIAMNIAEGSLLARAENSGSEACYVEVARWNDKTERFERFAFAKVFGGEHPGSPDATCILTAERFAAEINESGDPWISFIHRLPSWGSEGVPT